MQFLVAADVVSLSFFLEYVIKGYVCGISLRGLHVVWDFTRVWEDLLVLGWGPSGALGCSVSFLLCSRWLRGWVRQLFLIVGGSADGVRS